MPKPPASVPDDPANLDDIALESDPIDVVRAKRARRILRQRTDGAVYSLDRLGFGDRCTMVRSLSEDRIEAERVLAALRDDVQAYRRAHLADADPSGVDLADATLAALGSLWASLG